MSNPVDRIKKFIGYLPEGDRALASNFINVRDFESLKDLVFSDICKLERRLVPKDEQEGTNIVMLETLYYEVDSYVSLLNGYNEDSEPMELDIPTIDEIADTLVGENPEDYLL